MCSTRSPLLWPPVGQVSEDWADTLPVELMTEDELVAAGLAGRCWFDDDHDERDLVGHGGWPWAQDLDEAPGGQLVPGGQVLDATVAGPGLAALLAGVELGACSDETVVAAAAAAARVGAWAASVELAATAELAERVKGWRGVSGVATLTDAD